jgi:ribosomal protein S18 acetylase RimI-like enzyme
VPKLTELRGQVAYAARVAAPATERVEPSSLVWATDFDVLPSDHVIERRGGYLVVRSPSNPGHYWGNMLLFDDPPTAEDAARWERLFEAEFAAEPRVRHRTFGWDRVDGALGCAREEFVSRGYDLEETIGLVAAADQLRPHRRENREVRVRALDPAAGADGDLWDAVIELQVAGREEGHDEARYRTFRRARQGDLRGLFRAGRGGWYVALSPDGGEVLASCGIVVTCARGRFQAVDTAAAHRRRGICSRLLVEAARHSAERCGTARFVIVADAHYHALGLYESLGFQPREHVHGVCLWPRLGNSS